MIDFESLLIPVLRLIADTPISTRDMTKKLLGRQKFSEVGEKIFAKRVSWTVTYLQKAGFIMVAPCSRRSVMTATGKKFLKRNSTANRFILIRASEMFARYMYGIEMNRNTTRYDKRVLNAISTYHPHLLTT